MEEQKTEVTATPPPADPAAQPAPANPVAPAEAPPTKSILGRKIGMTRIYRPNGEFVPVTVVEAGPCPILQVKTVDSDGYAALQVGFGDAKEKNVNKALKGQFAKAQVKPVRWVREIRLPKVEGFRPGQVIRVTNFSEGDVLDVSGYSKGKGFAGVVKRHRFRGGPKTHGQSDRWRAPGTSGGQRPQRVFKGIRGPGHMGVDWVTVQRLTVEKVDADRNLLLLKGSVPGPLDTCLTIRPTTRPMKAKKVPPAPKAKKAAKQPAAAKAPAKK